MANRAQSAHNPHPGEILLEEFLRPLGMSQYALAKAVHVPPRRINEICLGKRGISADTALRLARYFGTSERLWLGLQADYDLTEARRSVGRKIDRMRGGGLEPLLARRKCAFSRGRVCRGVPPRSI
jgi:addiction module HigA family antidote